MYTAKHHGVRYRIARHESARLRDGSCGHVAKRRIAFASGQRIVELVKKNITPSKILTPEAFHNAITVDLALGGSTNTALHIPATAHEAA